MAERRRGLRGRGEKPKDFKGTVRKLLAYMGHYKAAVIAVMIFAAGSTVLGVIGPKILGNATTELFNGLIAKISGTGGIDFSKIGKILLFLMGIYAVSGLLSFIQGWIMTGISQKMSFQMREQRVKRILNEYDESFCRKRQSDGRVRSERPPCQKSLRVLRPLQQKDSSYSFKIRLIR